MKNNKQKLLIEQADRKLKKLKPLSGLTTPREGWVKYMRKVLNMSMRQLADRMNISAPSVNALEEREVAETVTINTLRKAAEAMEMKLVYAFIPKGESIEDLIEKQARAIAIQIVQGTSNTMRLEGQENSKKRIAKAIALKTEEIVNEMPRYLWE